MELSYSWWKEDDFYLGYIDEYPQYPTQGDTLKDLENGLVEIYGWIKDGTLKIKEQKGIACLTPFSRHTGLKPATPFR